jgi:phage terminase large subunit-like protein
LLTPGTLYNVREGETPDENIVVAMWQVPSAGEWMDFGTWVE